MAAILSRGREVNCIVGPVDSWRFASIYYLMEVSWHNVIGIKSHNRSFYQINQHNHQIDAVSVVVIISCDGYTRTVKPGDAYMRQWTALRVDFDPGMGM